MDYATTATKQQVRGQPRMSRGRPRDNGTAPVTGHRGRRMRQGGHQGGNEQDHATGVGKCLCIIFVTITRGLCREYCCLQ